MSETSVRVPASARRLVILGVVALAIVAADLATKRWALDNLSRPRAGNLGEACTGSRALTRARRAPVVLVPGHASLEYTENCGGAFGLLGASNEKFRYPFFILASIIAIGVIVSVYRRLEPGQKLLAWALPLVLGGALGNFHDRLAHRYVVDFVKVQLDERWVWPTFNVADAAITVGVALMLLDMVWRRRERPAPVEPAAGPVATTGTAAPQPAEAPSADHGEQHGA